jgi:formylglycine-generating enzyme required for sulfatase activity
MSQFSASGASSDRVSQLIQFLAAEQRHTSIEVAETLWLAMQMEPAAEIRVEEPVEVRSELLENNVLLSAPPPDEVPLLAIVPPRVSLSASTSTVGVLPSQALPVWVADPAMLTDALSIIRALKPLLQKVEAGLGRRLDEAATVDRIARTRLCLPILQPEKEPWFDLVLVIDRSSSMHIWQRLGRDLVRILRCYGAFRDVQVFNLAVDQSAALSSRQRVQLISNPDRPAHRPSEVIDQRGNRIVLVLSDCAGSYWWDGSLLPMLNDWGKVMPIAVWQMLPAWMWKRTALGRGTAVAIRNDLPGVANQRLQTQVQERGADGSAHRLAMPVVTSDSRDLTRWSSMVVGDRHQVTPGFLLPQQGGVVPRTRSIEDIARDRAQQSLDVGEANDSEVAFEQALEAIARERVQRFVELASPAAQRLMMLLAAAPVVTLPVVRLIRDSMLEESRSPLPVAEVFLSGLLQRLPGQENLVLDQAGHSEGTLGTEAPQEQQDLVQYDFAPRVRRTLLEILPSVDTIEVINRVSAAVERRWNRFSNESFQAFLTNPNVVAPESLAGLRSFATVTAEILAQLGGTYADYAQQFRHEAGGSEPPDQSQIEDNDFPLEDLEYEVAKLINFPTLQTCEYKSASITAILDRFDFETAIVQQARTKTSIAIQRRQSFAWGYTESLSAEGKEPISLDMIAIPSSSFTMGAPESEPESLDRERPQHEVTLSPFYLSRYPITQAQWRIVAAYEPIYQELDPDPSDFKGDCRPVENVSWDDAQEFCCRLSQRTRLTYRLPSEAEWEYACRAGTVSSFCFGETITTELVNYDGDETYNDSPEGECRGETTEIGSFPANEWGLHDMHGNVWEWCEDDWHENYEGAPNDGSSWLESSRENTYRILRGGSWYESVK